MEGRIHQVNISNGGVPKTAVEGPVHVGLRGVAGDRQSDTKHHGRPWQALCLYGLEVIDALVAEGHPIAPGAAGENLTISGIEWASLRTGDVLSIGDDLVARITAPATPCAKNSRWFIAGNHNRMSYDLHPGWSRWYAEVVSEGPVAAGDRVVVNPSSG